MSGGQAAAGATAERPLGVAASVAVVVGTLAAIPIALPSGYGLLWVASYASVGGLLVIRRPRNPIGWILLGLGWSLGLLSGEMDVTPGQFTDGSLSLPEMGLAWLLNASGAAFTLFAALMATFPSGRLPGGRWGTALRVALGVDVALAVLTAFAPRINVNMPGYPDGAMVPNPFAIAPDSPFWRAVPIGLLFFVGIGIIVLAAISLVARARRSASVEREQIRWVAASVGALIVAMVGGIVVSGAINNGIAYVPAILAFAALPISIGIAVLRYRLYDIDRIISRTLAYAIVTAVLAGVFGAAVLGLQALLRPVTAESQVAVAASTLLVAALFGPIRHRVQRVVDRRFDRSRYDAARVADGFGARLRDRLELDAVSAELASTAHAALRPASVSVWVRPRSGEETP